MSSLPLTEFALGEHITDIAEKWGARTAGPAEHEAVKSDIPTLILAGEFDQNTPSYWGKLVGETLVNSHYIEFPGAGYGVINNGVCALSVIKAFLDSPAKRPDDKCVKALTGPIFVTPEKDAKRSWSLLMIKNLENPTNNSLPAFQSPIFLNYELVCAMDKLILVLI